VPYGDAWRRDQFSMLKLPKSRSWRSVLGTGVKWVLIAEAVGLIGSYVVWKQMNTSQGELCGMLCLYIFIKYQFLFQEVISKFRVLHSEN
jgi:tryptophan-rich sensory protein